MRAGTVHAPDVHRRKDGTTFPIEYSCSLLTVGGRELVLGIDRDVTERKRSEDALRRSEQRFRATFDQAPVGISHTDAATGRWLRVNRRLLDILGYTLDEISRLTYRDITYPDDLGADDERTRRLLAGEIESFSMEKRYIRKDGSRVWVDLTVSLVRAATGEPDYCIAIAEDVTARKRAERELIERARAASLGAAVGAAVTEGGCLRDVLQRCAEALVLHLDAAFARVWTLNAAGDALELQASAGMYTHIDGPHARVAVGERKIGLIARERRPHLTNSVPDDPRIGDHEWAKREGMTAFAGYPLIVEDRLVGVMAMFARAPLPDSTLEALGSVADKVALSIERVRSEEALRASEANLAEAQRLAHLGSWEADLHTGAMRWSGEMYRILGFAPHEFPPAYEAIMRATHPDDRDRVAEAFRDALRTRSRFTVEHRIVRPTGEVRVVQARGDVAADATGTPVRMVGSALDVTERRRTERRSAALAALGERLNAATDVLSAARIIAGAADDLLGWDAFALQVYSAAEDLIYPILDFDVVDGRRVESQPYGAAFPPTPMSRQVIAEGPQLLLPEQPSLDLAGLCPFGDRARPSASLMFVPIHGPEGVSGILTIQSYTCLAYTDADLQTLQALADQCGAALERIRAGDELRRSEESLAAAQRIAHLGSWEWNLVTDEVSWSAEAYRLFGLPADFRPTYGAVVGRIHPDDRARVDELVRAAVRDRRPYRDTFRVTLPDGGVRVVDAQGEVVLRDGAPARMIGTVMDVTERAHYEEQLHHQAFHDPLTGLPNRALFMDRLELAILRGARRRRAAAVLYLDTDRFKLVNDSLGHDAGDLLLVEIAERLRACLRPEDTVARLGGDEFTVLIEDVDGVGEAKRVAERIQQALRRPFEIAGHEVVISISIGIAMTAVGWGSAELLRAADAAMYAAKRAGKARYEVYHAGMGAHALERLELETELRRALDRGELCLRYHPKVEFATGRVLGAEALLRWEHPSRGTMPPAEFVPLAEEIGLILPIGRWVLEEACRQASAWRALDPADRPPEVCVNVSAQQVAHPDLVADVAGVLEQTGLRPASLVLEITESAVMEDAERNVATLYALKELGVRLAIDDFGTGYSSLSYLHRFPVDALKIDRGFVDGLGHDSEDTAIVRSVIGLARSLGLLVVAEGVETEKQIERLRALGCEVGQGYYFAEPLTAHEMGALLARGGRLAAGTRV